MNLRRNEVAITFIIDTNVVFSALYRPASNPGILIFFAILDKIRLVAPESVRREIREKLMEKLEFSRIEAERILASLPIKWVDEAIYIDRIPKVEGLISDKTDMPLLALHSLSGYPIVTGDKEILNAKGIVSMSPKQAIDFLLDAKITNREEIEEYLSEIEELVRDRL